MKIRSRQLRTKIIIQNKPHYTNYIIAFVAVFALLINSYLTYKIVFPKAKLDILNSEIYFNEKASNSDDYFDSLYISFHIYNDGNKISSINHIFIYWDDLSDSVRFVDYRYVYKPDIISPGETKTVFIKIFLIKLNYSKYIPPYDFDGFPKKDWRSLFLNEGKETGMFGPDYPFKRPVRLRILLSYGKEDPSFYSTTFTTIWPINPSKFDLIPE